MQKILATKTASLTDLRDPMKVIEAAGDSPIAIMNRDKVVGYFVPTTHVDLVTTRYANETEVSQAFENLKDKMAPVLEYLKDK